MKGTFMAIHLFFNHTLIMSPIYRYLILVIYHIHLVPHIVKMKSDMQRINRNQSSYLLGEDLKVC